VSDAAGRAYRADVSHLFLVDPLGKRLARVSGRSGRRASTGEAVALDRGALGWVVRRGAPQAVTLTDPGSGGRMVSFLVPIRGVAPHGLLVLENCSDAEGPPELASLDEILQRVGEMIDVEKNLVAQEVLSQLQLRIQDQIPRLATLLPHERARSVLEFAVDLVAAECAVWTPSSDSRPIWTRPSGNAAAALQTRFRRDLAAVSDCVLAEGGAWAGADGVHHGESGAPAELPSGPAPWMGVTTPGSGGTLVVVFSPDDPAGTPAQVPSAVLLRILRDLAEQLPQDLRPTRQVA